MSKILIKRNKIEALYNKMIKHSGIETYNKFFSFFIIRNIRYFEPEYKSIFELRRMTQPNSDVIKFEQLRNDLIEKYADRNESGEVISKYVDSGNGDVTRVFNFTETKSLFESDFAKLTNDYKDILSKYDIQLREYNELMDEEIEIEVAKISFKHIPNDINISEFELFINEPAEELEKLLLE